MSSFFQLSEPAVVSQGFCGKHESLWLQLHLHACLLHEARHRLVPACLLCTGWFRVEPDSTVRQSRLPKERGTLLETPWRTRQTSFHRPLLGEPGTGIVQRSDSVRLLAICTGPRPPACQSSLLWQRPAFFWVPRNARGVPTALASPQEWYPEIAPGPLHSKKWPHVGWCILCLKTKQKNNLPPWTTLQISMRRREWLEPRLYPKTHWTDSTPSVCLIPVGRHSIAPPNTCRHPHTFFLVAKGLSHSCQEWCECVEWGRSVGWYKAVAAFTAAVLPDLSFFFSSLLPPPEPEQRHEEACMEQVIKDILNVPWKKGEEMRTAEVLPRWHIAMTVVYGIWWGWEMGKKEKVKQRVSFFSF